MKKLIILIPYALLCTFWISSAQATPFQNGDFESGNFTRWNGDLIITGSVDPDSSNLFSIIPNAGPNNNSNVAQIDVDDTDWLATLYQDFTLDSLLPGWTMDITFWIWWNPTASSQDGVSATLEDSSGATSIDLLSGVSDSALLSGTWVTADITNFAQTYGGQDVELAFTIQDVDWNTSATLQIDEISFRQHAPAPVPEPATILLMAPSLVFLKLRKRNSSNSS